VESGRLDQHGVAWVLDEVGRRAAATTYTMRGVVREGARIPDPLG
jgi:hypothetical protein